MVEVGGDEFVGGVLGVEKRVWGGVVGVEKVGEMVGWGGVKNGMVGWEEW